MNRHSAIRVLQLIVFVLLATANGAGYRYGVSDQAFYIPAFLQALDPSAFPRDAALIAAQARLMVLDEAAAAVVRATGLSLPVLFAAGYLVSLACIWAALVLVGDALYASRWTTAALLAAFTLRHRITRTSANSFEPYFHPRMLAFGVCALGLAAFLRKRPFLAVGLVGAGGVIHPTTGLWFAILVGAGLMVADRRLRPVVAVGAVLAAVAVVWAITAGPLVGSLVRIDAEWRQVLASKDSLFAHEWPMTAWLANLGTAAVWGWAYHQRRATGGASAEDAGLASGGAALVALFLVTLPAVAAGVALFVELQISRVFWVVDLIATIYLLAAVERRWPARRAIRAVAIGLLAVSVARGVYILQVEYPERRLFSLGLAPSPWVDAMRWLAGAPPGAHVLADPGHAWKYGVSVRVAAGRDVFQEDVKDSALAIYSRAVAMRVLERGRALGDFERLTAARADALAARYGLNYLVTDASMELPVAYRNDRFWIYRLDPSRAASR